MNKQMRRKKQNSAQVFVFILIGLLIVIRQIGLTTRIGNDGNAYFAAAYELAMLVLSVSAYALPHALTGRVMERMRSGQSKSASRILRTAFMFALLFSGLIGVACFFGAPEMAGIVLAEPLTRYAIQAFAPVLVVGSMIGILNGYFRGLGTRMPEILSGVVMQILLFLTMFLLAGKSAVYGEKVGNLLKNEHFRAAYGATGAIVGIGAGCLLGLLFLFLIFQLYRGSLKRQEQRDTAKNVESFSKSLQLLLGDMLPVMVPVFLYFLAHLVEQAFYNRHMADNAQSDLQAMNWGIYFGQYRMLTRLAIVIILPICMPLLRPIVVSLQKKNVSQAKERLQTMLHLFFVQAIPWTVSMAVLAKPCIDLLYAGDKVLGSGLLQKGSLIILCLSFVMLTGKLLQEMGKETLVMVHAVVSFVVQLGAFFVLLYSLDLQLYAAVYAELLGMFLFAFWNLVSLSRVLHYHPNWIRSLALPFGCAVGASIAQYLLWIGFSNLFGSLGVIPAALIGVILYLVALLALKGLSERELDRVAGGGLIGNVARMLHLL